MAEAYLENCQKASDEILKKIEEFKLTPIEAFGVLKVVEATLIELVRVKG